LLSSEMKTSLSPHSFRHTHASLLFESGATIKDVQKRLGHTNVNTTMDIYTHVTKSSERKAIDKLSNYANF
ncbi:tyrosine-type recombinase/integrase, partial [Enterococcus faecalis]|nr:tyrosine-type recombinase/integrase [Enterococcus faecalis]